ncbi:MAG: recombinase family protein [Oscillospiraceae bacterium]
MEKRKNIYAYLRVSTKDQNEARQVLAIKPYKIEAKNIYIDKQSGKDFNRPQYKKLMRRLKSGDLLIVKSIDRLGRNYEEIIAQWKYITKDKGTDIMVIDMPLLDTSHGKDLLGTFISDLVLQLLSFVAQNERDNIKSRQAEGIKAAMENGVRFGRKPKVLPENYCGVIRLWKKGKISATQAQEILEVSRSTLYRLSKKCETLDFKP